MRLVDADALKAIRFHDLPYSQIVPTDCDTDDKVSAYKSGWNDAIDAIVEYAPTVDPVRYGKWINDKGIYKCTACNDLCLVAGWAHCIPEKQMYEVFKFCPNCGAKMEETK